MHGRVRAAALVGIAVLAAGTSDAARAADSTAHPPDIVRTLCPNGETPVPNHSGCWCGNGDPAHRMTAAWPDADCSPAQRVEGPFCVYTCPHHDPPKPAAPACHNGLGHTVACPTDEEHVCAGDDYVWRSPPQAGCDAPPSPAERIYTSATPAKPAAAPAAPAWWRRTAATYVPAPVVGDIFIVFKYLSGDPHAERPVATSVAVEWGGWTHHGVILPPPGAVSHGFVIKLRHRNADTVPLNVATDGAMVVGPTQGPPPAELTAPGYQTLAW